MPKRRRRSGPSSSPEASKNDTPSKRTRRQTQSNQALPGAEDDLSMTHVDSGLGLESPTATRRSTRRSMHIDLSTIVQSPNGISASPSELSPIVPSEREVAPAPGPAQAPSEQAARRSETGYFASYRPPSRPLPANPRRPMTPVPGTVPKKKLGPRLRLAADHVKSNQFQYLPISPNQVRLIKLEKGAHLDRIKVALLTVPFRSLGTEFRFEALSYNWGYDNAAAPLTVSDESRPPRDIGSIYQSVDQILQPRDQMFVKYNLFEALYHLRLPDRDIWLWVDAICINQEDLGEKEVQVARISEIYVAADNVLVWLGEANDRTKSAVKLLHDLATAGQQERIKSDDSRLAMWKDLKHFMESTWFSRRWIIQELALAKNAVVYCGNDAIHWNDIRDGISWFVENEDWIRERCKDSKLLDHDYHALGDLETLAATTLVERVGDIFRRSARAGTFVATQGLEALVSSLSAFQSSDPRDTINALINISKEGIGLSARVKAQIEAGQTPLRRDTAIFEVQESGHIRQVMHLGRSHPPPPSYSKNLLDVYIDFLKWIVTTTGSINILCRHWAIPEHDRREVGYPELVKLPTWIKLTTDGPFVHKEYHWHRQNADCLVGLPEASPYNACDRFLNATIEFFYHEATEGPRHGVVPLALRKSASAKVVGLRLGTVEKATDPVSGGNIPITALNMLGWKRGQDAKEELKDDIWRPLVADRGFNGTNPPNLWRKSCADILMNHTDGGSINIPMIERKATLPQTKNFLKRMRQVTWNRRFLEVTLDEVYREALRSDDKSIGLGPSGTELADIVCILYGCTVPCILRPVGDKRYEFVGEAYMYGFMTGEAVTMLTTAELQERETSFEIF
ncbi:hypothetical protein LTR17_013145 [Elasticomyces elasticus]|nr:hypothetical protein LTR17_013145 [Elasticomyces elasticus]